MNRWLWMAAAVLAAHLACGPLARAQEYPAAPAGSAPAERGGDYIVVTAPEADVLADPRSGAVILLKVVKGDLLPLQGQLGDWYSVAAGEVTGWVRRESAALLFHPEFLDPARLRESYTPPPFVPHVPWGYWEYPGYSGYPGYPGYPGWWGRGIMPYPWRDPLSWGFWLYEGNRHDDHHDDHGHSGGGYRNRPPDPYPDRPPPPRDPRPR